MKFVFSTDVIHCGCLDSMHQLTNQLTCVAIKVRLRSDVEDSSDSPPQHCPIEGLRLWVPDHGDRGQPQHWADQAFRAVSVDSGWTSPFTFLWTKALVLLPVATVI